MVAPYNPPAEIPSDGSKGTASSNLRFGGQRYKSDILNDDDVDDAEYEFSRDEEDIGIGVETDNNCLGAGFFDHEDLFGDKENKKVVKNNKSKMLLDELEGGAGGNDTDHSLVQTTQ